MTVPSNSSSMPAAADAAPGAGAFRNRIPTAQRSGERIWVFARKPKGRFYRARTVVAWLLMALMIAGPFIKLSGHPLLMFNIVERKFSLFGKMFWPQDIFVFAVAMLTFLVMIVLFTAIFGRVWCGWLCPQTVLMEMFFRKIEYLVEGDASQQRALAAAPWTAGKVARKALKHGAFFVLSFFVGNWLLMYIIGSDAWWRIVSDNPLTHLQGLGAMLGFSLAFYGLFARFREQACTFICPYGRFQSVLLDSNSLIVSYDPRRGDPRQRVNRGQAYADRKAAGIGDCINCGMCVEVCPTGIDIRNGLQMECVHCTACIDACDNVMDRIGFPRGLIRYASQNGIQKGARFRATLRVYAYCALLLALGTFLGVLIATRRDVQTTVFRMPGALAQLLPDGRISNLYNVKILNKTHREVPVELKLESPAGDVVLPAGTVRAAPEQIAQAVAIVELPRASLSGSPTPVVLGVYADGRRIQTLKTGFIGPSP
jgi:cytochrome c oxidase accessory protein FixG